jgi:hypothetical protein
MTRFSLFNRVIFAAILIAGLLIAGTMDYADETRNYGVTVDDLDPYLVAQVNNYMRVAA